MRSPKDNLIGESSCFLEILEQTSQLAALNKPILIIGERGTGKELIAARLHYLSNRWDQAFVKLNCSAINENLLETELFGHESGAFTGANKKHMGRFELANKGTLFLDELGNSSQSVQEKLLRVIEYGEFERVGGNKTINIDVRIVAATNENLPKRAANNTFRADLLDRLAFDVITIPPLRARPSDIIILANHFALEMTRELKRDFFAGFTSTAERQLMSYSWLGNVRELKNVIERNIYKTPDDTTISQIQFDPFDSPYRIDNSGEFNLVDAQSSSTTDTTVNTNMDSAKLEKKDISLSNFEMPLDLKQTMAETEIKLIKYSLEKSQFNQKKCAEQLGLTYHQLRGYLKKYQLLDHK